MIILFLIGLPFSIHAKVIYKEDFENGRNSVLYQKLIKAGHDVRLIPQSSKAKAKATALRVTYRSNSQGSERIVQNISLSKSVHEASLSFDVKFEKDFQFVKGGKLHGLGPADPITGGQPMTPSGWSARLMFEDYGTLASYIYDQQKENTYGVTRIGKNFKFQKDKFYAMTLYTKLNSNANKADGEARVYVNGILVTGQKNIIFWKGQPEQAKISKFLFSTFHGGHEPSWAPKDADGHYVNVHAVFDNFIVEDGLRVRKAVVE